MIEWLGDTASNNNTTNEKLVARYVHTANKVLNIASLDIATGIFTTSNAIEGSYTAGAIIPMLVNYTTFIPNLLFAEWNGINEYRLEYIDSTHFYVVNGSSSNARITAYVTNTVDLTKIVFEYGTFSRITIDLSGVEMGNMYRTVVTGVRNRPSYSAVVFNFTYNRPTDGANVASTSTSFSTVDGRHFEVFYSELIFHYNPESGLFVQLEGRNATRTWAPSAWSYSAGAGSARTLDIYPNIKITSAFFNSGLANNSVIEIYTTA